MGQDFKFEIKSTWGKIIVLLLMAAGIANVSIGRTLETEAVEAIRAHILHGGYLRHALKEFENAGGIDAENVDELADDLLETVRAEVEIVSIKARGLGSSPVVRVEILINGKPPVGEDPVQYFRMAHSSLRGWQVENRTKALAFYLPFFAE